MPMKADEFLPDAETVAAIEKDIENYNERRRYAKGEVARRMARFFGPFVAGAVVLVFLLIRYHALLSEGTLNTLIGIFIFAGVALAIWGHSFATRIGEEIQQEFRDHILPVLFGWLDEMHYWRGQEPGTFAYIPDVLKGGSYNEKSFDDVISGKLKGKPFEIYEASLVQRRRRSHVVRFHGLVLVCKTAEPFPGTLIAMRRPGSGLLKTFEILMRSIGDLLSRERLETVSSDAVLDEVYEIRSDRPSEARALLSGRISDVLKWVAGTWRGGLPRLAVKGDALYLMLPSQKNFFELPPLDTPVSYQRDLEPMVREFASLLAIVEEIQRPDAVAGDEPVGEEEPAEQAGDATRPKQKLMPDGRPFIPLLDGREPPPSQ